MPLLLAFSGIFWRGGEDKTPQNENTEVWSGENKLEADVNVNVSISLRFG